MNTRNLTRSKGKIAAATVAAIVVAVLGLNYVLGSCSRSDGPHYAGVSLGTSSDTPRGVSTLGTSPSTSATPSVTAPGSGPTGMVIHGSVAPNGGPINGSAKANSMGKHTVVLKAWSAVKIPGLGWYIPTTGQSGKSSNQTSSWSQTFTVYGNGQNGKAYYAQLYLATDYRGIAAYCSLAVDGKVVAYGHSNGPYGDVMCMA